MPIQDLTGGDFVNQGVEKINDAFGEIPVSWIPTPDGNLVITKHNGEVVTIPLKNFFALLSTAFGSLAIALATPEIAGKVLLVDESIPEHFQSSNRVLTAAQVDRLLEDSIQPTIQEVLAKGAIATTAPQLNGGLFATVPLQPSTGEFAVGTIGPDGKFYRANAAEFAAWIKPYLNSTTPGTGPTVLNPIPNQTITAAGAFIFAANTFSGSGLTYTATKSDGSVLPFSFNGSARRFNFDSTLANGSISVLVTATDSAGQSNSTTFTITIAYAEEVPYIISILRKFVPETKTLYYLVKSSYTGDDTTKIPADRSKRAEESVWRTAGQAFLPSQEIYGFTTELMAEYPWFFVGNLSIDGNPVTNTIVQFKPYATAPDSTIIPLSFTYGSTPDFGTEVYHYTPGSAKITEFYTGRIAGPEKYLTCYANGSGTLKTNLIATGSTPVYASGLKVMATADGPYSNADLFSGTKPYGSLYSGVVNGTYTLSIIDEDGNSLTYNITVTDSGPISVLKAPTSGGGGGGGGGDTDLTTPHTLTGDSSGGFRVNNTGMLTMAYTIVSGRITNLHNTVSGTPTGGRVPRYLINCIWYAYVSGAWYEVIDNSGTLAGSSTNLSFSYELGVLVQLFYVNPGDPVDHWRDNPTPNASQLIRAL